LKNPLYIPIFLIFILVFSCGQNSSEKKLNGKWFEVENENRYNYWHFYQDSLLFAEDKVEWQASDSKIEFDYITYIWDSIGKQIDYQDKIVINYQLYNNNDSLFGILINKYGRHKLSLLKAKNYIEFLKKRYQIDFSLPEVNSIEHMPIDDKYGLKVFIGYFNEKVVGRTELSADLNQLESDIITFKDSIKSTGRPELDNYNDFRFHLRVFADKKISDSIITELLPVTIKGDISSINEHLTEKFKRKTTDTIPIRIYRIYESKEDERMKGKKIKTIANNVYN